MFPFISMYSSVLQHVPFQSNVAFHIDTSQLICYAIDLLYWFLYKMQHWAEMEHAAEHWNALK